MDSVVVGIVGGLLLLALGWLHTDIKKVADKVDTSNNGLANLQGQMTEHLRQHH